MANADEEVMDPNYNPEEEVAEGNWKIVDLPVVHLDNGEQNEEEVWKVRAKLYRWREKQWKERGIGELRFLRNKTSGKMRCALRQEQTMKVRCNFFVYGEGLCSLEKLKTAEKSWRWTCADLSEDKVTLEQFCARFKTDEDFKRFEEEFTKAYEANKKLNWTAKPADKQSEGDAKKEEGEAKEQTAKDTKDAKDSEESKKETTKEPDAKADAKQA